MQIKGKNQTRKNKKDIGAPTASKTSDVDCGACLKVNLLVLIWFVVHNVYLIEYFAGKSARKLEQLTEVPRSNLMRYYKKITGLKASSNTPIKDTELLVKVQTEVKTSVLRSLVDTTVIS